MDFWETLEEEYKDSGCITQQDFAALLEIDRSTLSRIVNRGKPSFDTLVQIAKKLELLILAKPPGIKASKKGSKECTEFELRDCLERFRGLDERDIDDLMFLAKHKTDQEQKGGAPTKDVV